MTGPGGPMTRREAAELLAVDLGAAPAEVQRAFLRVARRVHPDVLPEAGEDERRRAAAAFDRLLRARDLLLSEAPDASAAPSAATLDRGDPEGPRYRRVEGRGLGGSLVVLALLAFLLVLIVTVQQGFRGGPVDPAAPGLPVSSTVP